MNLIIFAIRKNSKLDETFVSTLLKTDELKFHKKPKFNNKPVHLQGFSIST